MYSSDKNITNLQIPLNKETPWQISTYQHPAAAVNDSRRVTFSYVMHLNTQLEHLL
jgi:adenine C2-methylase RlmN of 23S rRNA A2503 and tRNA A37